MPVGPSALSATRVDAPTALSAAGAAPAAVGRWPAGRGSWRRVDDDAGSLRSGVRSVPPPQGAAHPRLRGRNHRTLPTSRGGPACNAGVASVCSARPPAAAGPAPAAATHRGAAPLNLYGRGTGTVHSSKPCSGASSNQGYCSLSDPHALSILGVNRHTIKFTVPSTA